MATLSENTSQPCDNQPREHTRPPRRRGSGVMLKTALAAVALVVAGALGTASAQASEYFIQADVVRGAIGAQGAVCVANGVFMQGEQVVFRAYVFDASTGERLTAEEVEARGVRVFGLIEGERVEELDYIPHPPNVENPEFFWAGGWMVPADQPTGNYPWSLQVEDAEGNTAEYLPMGHSIGLGSLVILEATTPPADGPPGDGDAPDAPNAPDAPDAPGGGGGAAG